jgi:hypothetical protein
MWYNLSIDKENKMGIMKNVVSYVQDMYCDGWTPIEIAECTGLQFSEVIEILEMYGEIV